MFSFRRVIRNSQNSNLKQKTIHSKGVVPLKRTTETICGTAVPSERNSKNSLRNCCSFQKEQQFCRVFLLFLLEGTTVSQIVSAVLFKGTTPFEWIFFVLDQHFEDF